MNFARETMKRVWKKLPGDTWAVIFLCLGIVGLDIISSYVDAATAQSDTFVIALLVGLIVLLIEAYRVGRKFAYWDRVRYARFIGWVSLFFSVGLLIMILTWLSAPGTEGISAGYHLSDFLGDTIALAIIFLIGFSCALGIRLAHFGLGVPKQIKNGFRLLETKFFARPLLVLRVMVLLFVILFVGGIWLGVTTLTRLSAIEHALGGREALRCDAQESVERISPSVVRIIGGLGEGSGFAVAKHYIITNHHVIDGEPSPKIVYSDGLFENGVVVAADADKDMAVIHVDRDLVPLPWANWGSVQLGQTLLLLGYPYGGNLNGQVTINRATVAAFRGKNDDAARYIQTDGGLIEGMSGGPMVSLCGEVVAVNAAGGESMGVGIEADTARNWLFPILRSDPVTPWESQTATINPDASPTDAVRAYYGYISARNYEAAYAMLSSHFIGEVSYADWAAGFGTQLQTAILSIKVDPNNKWRVFVSIESTDLVDGNITYKEFEGSWLVSRINGHLQLWESNIKETAE